MLVGLSFMSSGGVEAVELAGAEFPQRADD